MKKKLVIAGAIITVLALIILAVTYFSSSQKKEIQLSEDIQTEELLGQKDMSDNQPENLTSPDLKQSENENVEKDSTGSTSIKPKENERTSNLKINNKLVSWGFQKADNRAIDTIIIHSSYNAVGSDPYNLDDIIYKEYKLYGVSPHYIVSREGKVYRLVEDKNIAYHAGESKTPDGRTNVNNFSIGIEIVNKQSEGPSEAQYESLKNLLNFLKSKYKIKYILGHSDIAPGRKDDPWNFNWDKIK